MNDETAQEFGVCARAKGRREAQRAINKRDRRRKQAPLQDNTPADVRTLLLVLGGFLLALFLVTKMALGL